MKHFHPKSLLFYGTMIGSVTLLFRLVTLYGEQLQAPPAVNGRYVSTQSLSGCPTATRLMLDLQQSGIYLNATLRLINLAEAAAVTMAEEKPSLNGLWRSQQIELTGTTTALDTCQIPDDRSIVLVSIQGEISQSAQPTFTGEIAIGANSAPLPFTAEQQAVVPQHQGH